MTLHFEERLLSQARFETGLPAGRARHSEPAADVMSSACNLHGPDPLHFAEVSGN